MKLVRVIIAIVRPIVKVLFPYEVRGRENIPSKDSKEGLVICCNHISLLDPVFLLLISPRHIHFMAKQETFESALGRWFLGDVVGAFHVKRGTGDTSALDTAVNIVREGRIMGIFPEGTRSKTGEMGRFKSGASLIVAQTGAKVLPVAVYAKDGKVRPFRKNVVVFGPLLTQEEMQLAGNEKPNLRAATRTIFARVNEMYNEVKACR